MHFSGLWSSLVWEKKMILPLFPTYPRVVLFLSEQVIFLGYVHFLPFAAALF